MFRGFRNGAESDTENELRLRAETGGRVSQFPASEMHNSLKLRKTSLNGLLVDTKGPRRALDRHAKLIFEEVDYAAGYLVSYLLESAGVGFAFVDVSETEKTGDIFEFQDSEGESNINNDTNANSHTFHSLNALVSFLDDWFFACEAVSGTSDSDA